MVASLRVVGMVTVPMLELLPCLKKVVRRRIHSWAIIFLDQTRMSIVANVCR